VVVVAEPAVGDAIVELPLFVDVPLGQDIIAQKPPVFTPSRHCCHPVEIVLAGADLRPDRFFI
jgi:hypothetical protein